MDKKQIYNDVWRTLREHEQDYEPATVADIVDKWLAAKAPLIELLRKHPNWSEDNLAIVFDYDTSRAPDLAACESELRGLCSDYTYAACREYADNSANLARVLPEYINLSSSCESAVNLMEADGIPRSVMDNVITVTKVILYFMAYADSASVSEDLVRALGGLGFTAYAGRMVSRTLNKILKGLHVDDVIDKSEFRGCVRYDTYISKIADNLNPIRVTRHTLLSVHPCDYLNMSSGNGWRSCHNIYDGCYMAGTLSYAGDDCSMIFYTVRREYDGKVYWAQEKINRQVYAYKDNVLLQSRLYPCYSDAENCTNFRNAVQSIIATCLGKTNMWTLTKDVSTYVDTSSGALHYPDYDYDIYKATVSLLKEAGRYPVMYVGEEPLCISCGEVVTESGSLHCDDCAGSAVCANCGSRCSRDTLHLIDGEWYCEDCCNWCDRCESYHIGDYCIVQTRRGEEYWCNSCVEGHAYYCDWCDSLSDVETTTVHTCYGERYYCNDCLIEKCFECEECGEFFTFDFSSQDPETGELTCICKDCAEKIKEDNIV